MSRLLNLLPWRRRRLERDLRRELTFHIDRRVQDLQQAGVDAAEARRQAAIEFGGVLQVQEDVRETWTWRWIEDLDRDLRYAGRTLARSPGFTATAMLSLALGIGGSAALFSLVDQVLLRALPVNAPHRLVQVAWRGNTFSSSWGFGSLVSYPLCRDLHAQQQFFDGVLCRRPETVRLSTGDRPEPIRAEIVSGTYFSVLGVGAAAGRLIEPADDEQPGAHPVVVVSHALWTTRFDGARDVVGRKVLVNNYPMTVIGVAQAGFRGVDPLAPPALWIPAAMTIQAANIDAYWDRLLDRRAAWLHAIGRLKPGVTAADARIGLRPWFASMLESDTRREGFPKITPDERRAFMASTLDVTPGAGGVSGLRQALERPLWVLMGGTALLLLLGVLNVAGLLLARGMARTRELTTRLAIGARRLHIVRQLLVESLLITIAGGVAGLAAAPVVGGVLLSLLSPNGELSARLDRRAVLFAFVASVAAGIFCGLAPAIQTRRIALVGSLRERSGAAGRVRLRKLLVVGQMAFTLILMIAAGLFVRTLDRLYDRNAIASTGLVMVSISPSANGYSEADAERAMREVLRRLREVPAVERVTIANTLLLNGGWTTNNVTIQADGRVVNDRPVSRMRVGPGFFAALGARIIAGRDFDERDVGAPGAGPTPYRSVIVNESFARRYFKNRSPVGYRLGLGNRPDTVPDIEIVGVVSDFSRRSLRDGEMEQLFLPYWNQAAGNGTFYLKLRGSADSGFAAIRAAVAQVDPALPVSLTTFDEQVERSLRTERMLATLSSGFGAMALLLSVIGLYGVMSFVVTQRTPEIGVRMALGATRSNALWLIVRDASVMVAAGTAVGLPAAWALRRVVEAQLFGIRAFDGTTIALAAVVLALAALGAAALPAWRAASISPTDALRVE